MLLTADETTISPRQFSFGGPTCSVKLDELKANLVNLWIIYIRITRVTNYVESPVFYCCFHVKIVD